MIIVSKEQLAKSGEDLFFGESVNISRPHLSEFGSHIAIDPFFHCTTRLIMRDYIHIASHVSIIGGAEGLLQMDDFSFIATGSRIICGSEDYTAGGLFGATVPAKYKAHIKYAPVTFEPMSGVGANTVVMPGVTLAIGSMVGAGAVVTRSTQAWGVYIGAPAKLYKLRTPEDIAKTLRNAEELGYRYKL